VFGKQVFGEQVFGEGFAAPLGSGSSTIDRSDNGCRHDDGRMNSPRRQA
jgi:hypothetical protein